MSERICAHCGDELHFNHCGPDSIPATDWPEVNTGLIPYGAKVYLAGPMRGYPYMNFPLFMEAEKALKNMGFIVFNPAHHDANNSFDPDDPTALDREAFREFAKRDLPQVADSDAVIFLPGWENFSFGAMAEFACAKFCWIPSYNYRDLSLITHEIVITPGYLTKEVRRQMAWRMKITES